MIYPFDLLGNFHPVVLHIPIGIMSLAFLLQYFFPKKIANDTALFGLLLICGSISSFISLFLGWLLSFSSDYSQDLLQKHGWTAFSYSMLTVLTCFLHFKKRDNPVLKKWYDLCFILCMILLLVAGHYGGTLTHGEGFLFSSNAMEENTKGKKQLLQPLTDSSSELIYNSLVEPVFQKKCQSCHNPKKLKGGFRMDEYAYLMQGGKSGKVIISGFPEKSELIKRILMDENEEKHMPPKGKTQLDDKEIKLLHWWILNGATENDIIRNISSNDTVKLFLQKSVQQSSNEHTLPGIPSADSNVVKSLRELGFSIKPVEAGSAFLQVSAINFESLNDEDLQKLEKIAQNILWLDVSHHPITERGLTFVKLCNHISRIDMRYTKITDGITDVVAGLKNIEYLNVVGTDCSNNSLRTFAAIKSLKQLYCWDTKITAKGVEEIQKERTDLVINMGEK